MLDGGSKQIASNALKNVSSLSKLKSRNTWSECLKQNVLKLIAPSKGQQIVCLIVYQKYMD